MKVNDCGLSNAVPDKTDLAWTYTAAGPRHTDAGDQSWQPLSQRGGTPEWVEATHLSLSYPYQWSFGRVSQVVVPGSNFVGPST